MKKITPCFSTVNSLSCIVICLILFSCNNSFNVLNRKYRQGYSFTLSSNKPKLKTQKRSEKLENEIKTDSIIAKLEDETFSCSSNNEPLIINYKPKQIIFVCDTPPKKNVEEPWSLYKPMEPKEEYRTEKHLEPLNFASLAILILLGFLPGIQGASVLIFILILFTLNIISLIKIKRNPGKYKKFSKISAIVLLTLLSLAILIAGFGALASL